MNPVNLIELALSLVLEAWLFALLLWRGVYREFPLFLIYVGLSLPATAGRLLTVGNYQLYFVVFWCSNAVLLLLGLAALHEVFRWVYAGFYEFWWFRLVYYGAIGLVLLITLRNALVNPPVQTHPLVSLAVSMGISINLLQAGIVALFGVFAKPLAIEHRRYPFGIVAGFAASSLGAFFGYFGRSIFGKKLDIFTQNVSAVAYIFALVIWLAAFARPEPEESAWTPAMPPEEMLRVVRGYLRALGTRRKDE
jgi:hypothetical protein